jgi:hypothetical protein
LTAERGPRKGDVTNCRKATETDRGKAIKRGATASAVATEILDRNLPRLKITADY